jgi:hypothetical protein
MVVVERESVSAAFADFGANYSLNESELRNSLNRSEKGIHSFDEWSTPRGLGGGLSRATRSFVKHPSAKLQGINDVQ